MDGRIRDYVAGLYTFHFQGVSANKTGARLASGKKRYLNTISYVRPDYLNTLLTYQNSP